MSDAFDKMLISSATILRRATGSSTANYGQPTSATPTTVATGVPCRVSTKGTGREFKYDKKVVLSDGKVFMRKPTTWTLNEKDWILVGSDKYNVLYINNPSNLDHHLEAFVEILSS